MQIEAGGSVVEQGEPTPEWPAFLAATIILLIAFGSVVASGLPIVTALFGLGVGSMLVGLLTAIVAVPDWAPAVSNLLAIGVGIDYALLVLTRFRDALDRDPDVHAALVESLTTAGRSVLVAGGTVVIAVMGLFLVGVEYMRGTALATGIAVLVVMITAVTLLPALLAMLGARVNKWKLPGVKSAHERRERENDPDHLPIAARWSRHVQRRPWPMALAATAVLVALCDSGTEHEPRLPRRIERCDRLDQLQGLQAGREELRRGLLRPDARSRGSRERRRRTGRCQGHADEAGRSDVGGRRRRRRHPAARERRRQTPR